jgi:hypothetical protein
LTWRVQGAMAATKQQPRRVWSQWQIGRIGSAAAACLVIGFFIGSAGRHGQMIAPTPDVNLPSVAVNTSNTTPASSAAGLLVPVTDESGQVVAWQPFDSASQAKAFTEDLHRARVPASGNAPDVRLASQDTIQKF